MRYLAVGRQLGYGMYLGLDALTYLDAAGIKRSEFAKRCQREAYKAWVLGLACSALSGVYSLWVLNGRMVSATATATGKKSVGGGSDVEDKVEGKKIARYVVLLTVLVLAIFVCRLIIEFLSCDQKDRRRIADYTCNTESGRPSKYSSCRMYAT